MCFSTQASFLTASIIGTIGLASVAKAKKPLRLLAVTPLLFAIQQALEGINCITLDSSDTTSLFHKASLYGFVVFASIVWPIWVPFVLFRSERNKARKKLLGVNIIIGCFIALVSMMCMFFLGWRVELRSHHIHYLIEGDTLSSLLGSFVSFVRYLIFYIYLLPTVGSFFITSLRHAWLVGAVLLVGWLTSIIFYSMAFSSVWCFFAALGSAVIYYIVKKS